MLRTRIAILVFLYAFPNIVFAQDERPLLLRPARIFDGLTATPHEAGWARACSVGLRWALAALGRNRLTVKKPRPSSSMTSWRLNRGAHRHGLWSPFDHSPVLRPGEAWASRRCRRDRLRRARGW